jgi:hypothetical protein
MARDIRYWSTDPICQKTTLAWNYFSETRNMGRTFFDAGRTSRGLAIARHSHWNNSTGSDRLTVTSPNQTLFSQAFNLQKNHLFEANNYNGVYRFAQLILAEASERFQRAEKSGTVFDHVCFRFIW